MLEPEPPISGGLHRFRVRELHRVAERLRAMLLSDTHKGRRHDRMAVASQNKTRRAVVSR